MARSIKPNPENQIPPRDALGGLPPLHYRELMRVTRNPSSLWRTGTIIPTHTVLRNPLTALRANVWTAFSFGAPNRRPP